MRRGNLMPLHELLGKTLAGFKLCRSLRGAEDAQPAPGELIHNPQRQRQLRTHNGDVRLLLVGNPQQTLDVSRVAGQTDGFLADSSIARHTQHLRDTLRLAQPPYQRVFPSTVTDYQDFHAIRRYLRINQTGADARTEARRRMG